ncbi:MAG: hypothetical protein QM758_26395 [Armatimonas sp.]
MSIAGTLRALYVYFRWLKASSLWTRNVFIAINLVPILVNRLPYDHHNTFYLFVGIFLFMCNLVVLICSALVHTLVFLQEAGNYFLQQPRWRKVLSLGVLSDLLIFWLLRA